jgi:hypothetical protein
MEGLVMEIQRHEGGKSFLPLELNYAQYLLFDFSKRKKLGPYEKTVEEKVEIPGRGEVDISFQVSCPIGAPGDFEFRLLLILLKMTQEQKNHKVHWFMSDIIERMKLKGKRQADIKRGIDILFNTRIYFKKGFYNKIDKIYKSQAVNPLIGYNFSEKNGQLTSKDRHTATINPDIYTNITLGHSILVNEETFFKLNGGVARRLFYLIEGRREAQGDHFAFPFEAIIELLGLKKNNQTKNTITSAFEEIKGYTPGFDFGFIKKYGREGESVFQVEFPRKVLKNPDAERFYLLLLEWYGAGYLESVKVDESTIANMERGQGHLRMVSYDECHMPKYQLILDQLLYQYQNTTHKEIRNIFSLLKSKIDDPDYMPSPNYKWIDIRAKEKEVRDLASVAKRKEVEKEIDENLVKTQKTKSRKDFLDEIKDSDPEKYESLKAIALIEIDQRCEADGNTGMMKESYRSIYLVDEMFELYHESPIFQ